jgi:hypothetical protein
VAFSTKRKLVEVKGISEQKAMKIQAEAAKLVPVCCYFISILISFELSKNERLRWDSQQPVNT